MSYSAVKLYRKCYADINMIRSEIEQSVHQPDSEFNDGLMKVFDICLNVLKSNHIIFDIEYMGEDAE